MVSNKVSEHKYNGDTDRCICGGVVVYFEDGDKDGNVGEGCEVGFVVWRCREGCGEPAWSESPIRRCKACAGVIDEDDPFEGLGLNKWDWEGRL